MRHRLICNALAGISLVLLSGMSCGCQIVRDLLHDDEAVAKAGKHILYRSELNAAIPDGISRADSTDLAMQYINSWAAEQIFSDMALAELPKEDQNVERELQTYKRSLLRYRYEQRYINERLDTTITESQMLEYYNSHQALFTLERPILKVRFVDIYSSAAQLNTILRKMASNRPGDVVEVDSIARECAIKYFDSSQQWMDAAVLAKEFGVDYGTMLSHLSNSFITFESPDKMDIKTAFVREIKRSGTAPFEYAIPQIREYLLSSRKRALLDALERNLLTQALDREQFVIY